MGHVEVPFSMGRCTCSNLAGSPLWDSRVQGPSWTRVSCSGTSPSSGAKSTTCVWHQISHLVGMHHSMQRAYLRNAGKPGHSPVCVVLTSLLRLCNSFMKCWDKDEDLQCMKSIVHAFWYVAHASHPAHARGFEMQQRAAGFESPKDRAQAGPKCPTFPSKGYDFGEG